METRRRGALLLHGRDHLEPPRAGAHAETSQCFSRRRRTVWASARGSYPDAQRQADSYRTQNPKLARNRATSTAGRTKSNSVSAAHDPVSPRSALHRRRRRIVRAGPSPTTTPSLLEPRCRWASCEQSRIVGFLPMWRLQRAASGRNTAVNHDLAAAINFRPPVARGKLRGQFPLPQVLASEPLF